ncbi:MAG: hypothetical protein ACK4TA_02715 [Saprospiraceae bacterium]
MSEFGHVVKDGAQEVGKKAWRGTKRILLILLAVGVVILAGYMWFNYAWAYSEGTRSGTLIKVSRKGYIFKTYEGQLNLGGFQSNPEGGVASNIWEFSVTDDAVYEKLQRSEGKQIVLHYKQYRKSLPWQGDTSYFVEGVELVK